MTGVLRKVLVRFIGAWVGAGFVWLCKELAIEVEPGLVEQTTEAVVNVVLFFGAALLSTYGPAHKLMESFAQRGKTDEGGEAGLCEGCTRRCRGC